MIYSITSHVAMAQAIFVEEAQEKLVLEFYGDIAKRLEFIRDA